MTATTCKDCDAPVVHAITEGGRQIELNTDPSPDGTIVPVQVDGHPRARVLTSAQLPADGPAWQRHSQTCPNSPAARAHRARHAPRCRVCTNPMDPDLAALEQWTCHPCCDQAAGAATVRAALGTTRGAGAS